MNKDYIILNIVDEDDNEQIEQFLISNNEENIEKIDKLKDFINDDYNSYQDIQDFIYENFDLLGYDEYNIKY